MKTTNTQQQELKNRFTEIISTEVWPHSQHMIDYCKKQAAYIVPLDNGDIAEIEKPSIETSFCFGYGYCGVSTTEDHQRAIDCANHARTKEEYFISENLKGLDEMIDDLKDDTMHFYKFVKYYGSPDDSNLKGVRGANFCHTPENAAWQWTGLRSLKELTETERQELIKGYETVKEQFIKRLNTYLKRYGLSKLHVWTYLSD